MIRFFVENPLFVVLLCVGIGYIIGQIDLGPIPNNSTLGTMYAAVALNLIISSTGASFQSESLSAMKIFFGWMFLFILGYEGGPLIRGSIRTSGVKISVKILVLALFYGVCVFLCGSVLVRLFGFGIRQANGFLSGSQTLDPLMDYECDVVVYVLTFIVSTLGMVFFMVRFAPRLVGTDLISAAREKAGAGTGEAIENATLSMPVQIRAYRVDEDSPYGGKTIDELEAVYEGRLQIESVYRDGVELPLSQSLTVLALDIIVVVGNIRAIDLFDNQGLTETTEEDFISYEMAQLDIVVAEKRLEGIQNLLSDKGILLQRIRRKGREIAFSEETAALKGDILSVVGRPQTITRHLGEIGYIKESGDSADVPFLLLPIALAIPFGLLGIPGTQLRLGASCGTLLLGMLIGCLHESHPKMAYISPGARWLLKNMGLDLFIAATSFEIALLPSQVFVAQNLVILLAGLLMFLLPGVAALLFGRFILRLAPADLLGGLCGCFSSTPAFNALTELTGSTVFTVGFTPAYVITVFIFITFSSVLLTML